MQHAGELYSLTAALIWATAVILLRRSGETTTPFSLNQRFKIGQKKPDDDQLNQTTQSRPARLPS